MEGIVALVGFPERVERPPAPDPIRIDPLAPPAYNSLAVLADGEVAGVYRKLRLPNYGVFDERRYFEPGEGPALIEVDGALVGLTVCEDIWVPGRPESRGGRRRSPAGGQLPPLALPPRQGRRARGDGRRARARDGAAFALCNMVGGQDELVFDGRSVVVAPNGEMLARAAQFEQELLVCDLLLPRRGPATAPGVPCSPARSGAHAGGRRARLRRRSSEEREVYAALRRAARLRREERLRAVVLGLSGGIDSALVAMVAADALGAERVTASSCPPPTPATRPRPTRARSPPTSAPS